jgi:hypothetical protein
MGLKADFLAVATLIKALPNRNLRMTIWAKMKAFAGKQYKLEREELDRIDRTDQDITDSKADADIDL